MKLVLKAVASIGLALLPNLGAAQSYPSQEVTLIVPFAPGGTNDQLARFLADHLGKKWNQAVVVDNRPGAGSTLGMGLLSKAKPDGYTLALTSSSFTTSVATIGKLPFDPVTDLQPVAMAARVDRFVSTQTDGPLRSLADVVAAAKTQKIFYGTNGVGSIAHMTGELMDANLGIDTEAVHFKGGSEVMTDLAGGRIQVVYGGYSDLISGLGKPIAVLSDKRSAVAPDVPTVAEAGFAETVIPNWLGIFAPSGTPAEVLAVLHKDISDVMASEAAAAYLQAQAGSSGDMSTEDFTAYYKAEIAKWTELAAQAGMSKQ